jgi:hypothetical protein
VAGALVALAGVLEATAGVEEVVAGVDAPASAGASPDMAARRSFDLLRRCSGISVTAVLSRPCHTAPHLGEIECLAGASP